MPAQYETTPGAGDGAEGAPPAGRGRRRWTGFACALLAVGLAGSLGGAVLWRSSVRTHARQSFQVTATDVKESLGTLLLRDADLVTALRAVLTLQPHMSATRFDEWFAGLQGRQRQVGGLGTTVVESVPAAELAAFQARRDADPAFRELMGGRIEPVAPSGRRRYCLFSAGGAVRPFSPAAAVLLQGDWCNPATPIGAYPAARTTQALLLQSIAASGQFLVHPVTAQVEHAAAGHTPVASGPTALRFGPTRSRRAPRSAGPRGGVATATLRDCQESL
jgi:hypothetical protein